MSADAVEQSEAPAEQTGKDGFTWFYIVVVVV